MTALRAACALLGATVAIVMARINLLLLHGFRKRGFLRAFFPSINAPGSSWPVHWVLPRGPDRLQLRWYQRGEKRPPFSGAPSGSPRYHVQRLGRRCSDRRVFSL
jgi:hypothetical protein